MKYIEKTLSSWTSPISYSEEERVQNTINMIKGAIDSSEDLKGLDIEIFAQGSYANNTNVKQNSDIDICVMLTSTFYGNYLDGMTYKDYGFSSGSISYERYKTLVLNALIAKFGYSVVSVGNKCINIDSNTYHVQADVVPAFQYRDYKLKGSSNPDSYIEGIIFFASDGTEVINYPKDHTSNGRTKNKNTNYFYKKIVRIMKHIRNNMVEDGLVDGDIISSFLVECLVWNVPNKYLVGSNLLADKVQDSIAYLWNAINNGEAEEWVDVSERYYLFHSQRKWTEKDAKDFLYDMYNYLEFE